MSRNLNNLPFAPSRVPFFYGWIIVIAGTLGVTMSAPGQTVGVSAFTDHLIDALGLTRQQLSLAYMIGTASSGLILTFAGKLYDRWGGRTVALLSCIGLGGMLTWCSQSDHLAAWLAGATGTERTAWAFGVILLGFFGIRFCGQGVLTMTSRNMVMKWFDRHRGLANGMMGVGIALGLSSSPLVFSRMIEQFGWRGAWWLLAGVVGGGFSVVVLLLYRDNPEDCGLVPDGSLHDDDRTVAAHLAHRQFTLGEAARSYSFWVFAMSFAMFALYMTAMSFHVESVFALAGMDRTAAFSIFLPSAVIATVCHFAGGWVSDYVPLKWLLVLMLISIGASMAFLADLSETTRWGLIVSNGVVNGLFGVLSAVTWPRLFGRKHLGAISGLAMSIIVIGSAIGPWLFSIVKMFNGSYDGACLACLAVTAILLAAAIPARNPQKRIDEAE